MRSALIRIDRYGRGAIAFHWTIAALVVVNLAIGLLHDEMPRGWRAIPLHKSIGLTVLALTLGRIAWRVAHRPPPLPPAITAWQRKAAGLVHALLYLLMLAMPLSGWVMVSSGSKPRPLDWFGVIDVPYLRLGGAAGAAAGTSHLALGYLMTALTILHVAGALSHGVGRRESVLGRMLPVLKSNQSDKG